MTDRLDILRLAYDAGLRGLEEQRQTLSEARTLSGQGVALGTAASGVLGGLALGDGHWSFWAALAIAAWAMAAGCAIYVLAPRGGWTFNMDSSTLQQWSAQQPDGTSASLIDAYANAAEYLANYHGTNNTLLRKVQRAQLAVLSGVGVSVAGWVVHLAIS